MLNIYGLLVIVVQTLVVFGNPPKHQTSPTTVNPLSNLWSKFHQNDYKITYERTELHRCDEKYVECEFRTFKYNRSTPVLNASLTLKIDVGYSTEVISQVYKLSSNEYRIFPLRLELNFCDTISYKTIGLDALVTNGNFVCPLVKGKKYYVNNFAPNPERFPPLIPSGHYMMEMEYIYQSIELVVTKNYGIIDRPLPIPEN